MFLMEIFFRNSFRWGLKSLKRLEDLRIGHYFLIPHHYKTVNCAHLGTKDSDSWINRWESEILLKYSEIFKIQKVISEAFFFEKFLGGKLAYLKLGKILKSYHDKQNFTAFKPRLWIFMSTKRFLIFLNLYVGHFSKTGEISHVWGPRKIGVTLFSYKRNF